MTLYVAEDNGGNAVLDKPMGDTLQQKFYEMKIRSVMLDEMLWPDPCSPPPHINWTYRATKCMCWVVPSGSSQPGTSTKELLSTMHAHGFDIYESDGPSGTKIAPEMYGNDTRGIYDLTAKLHL